jgi:hypothetical protein
MWLWIRLPLAACGNSVTMHIMALSVEKVILRVIYVDDCTFCNTACRVIYLCVYVYCVEYCKLNWAVKQTN